MLLKITVVIALAVAALVYLAGNYMDFTMDQMKQTQQTLDSRTR